MRIDVDKLPMKRLHAIDEIGNEQFPQCVFPSFLAPFFLFAHSNFIIAHLSNLVLVCQLFLFRDKSNEEQRLSAIHRIDFSSVVEKEKEKERERENEKQKEKEKDLSKSKDGQQQTWQGLVENLQQAQHELSVILDLISTVTILELLKEISSSN